MLPEIAEKYHAKVAEYERNYCAAGKPSFYCEYFAVAQHAKKALKEAREEARSLGFDERLLQKHIAATARDN